MCRWMGWLGQEVLIDELLFKTQHGIVDQSLHSRMGAETTNGDGFGMGWYGAGDGPGVYHSVAPAWGDANLRELAGHIESPLFLAHVRAAIGSLLCGIAVLVLLRRGARRGPRSLAIVAVAAVIWGWGIAQNPYLLPQKLTIADAAAPSATLTSVLIVFGIAVVLVLPSIGLLYTLVQRNLVEETSQPSPRADRRSG